MMTEFVHLAMRAVLAFLVDITKEDVRPCDAERRLRSLAASHPSVRMQLLWEKESYDDSMHYDVLIFTESDEVVSVSLCPNRALPWPLRGVLRWTEGNLVQVNGHMLTIEAAIGLVDTLWNSAPLAQRIVNSCLMREALAREPITVDDKELQCGVDAVRRAHALYDAEDTERWMRERGLTQLQLERMISEHLTYEQLQKRLTAGRLPTYLASHLHEFDTARIALIEVSDAAHASYLRSRIAGGTSGFLSAMHDAFLSGEADVRCSFESRRRRDIDSTFDAQLFAAQPGEVVGPVQTGASYTLGCLLGITQACDDADTRTAAEQVLFEQWLEKRRREAAITWHWGRASAAT